MSRTRRRIDAALKAKIALEALRDQATAAELAARFAGELLTSPVQIAIAMKYSRQASAAAFSAGKPGS